jgi:hypothetical protein
MGFVYACALSFMSKYLYQSCGPKPMTRVDINDNNQSSNNCGMFQILERIENLSYMLALLASMSIHNIFHVSLLKNMYLMLIMLLIGM